MSFNDIVARDAHLFTDPDKFPGVENVTYIKHPSTSVSIGANVFRNVPVRDSMGRIMFQLQIFVSKSNEIQSINQGGDQVTLADERGSATTKTVTVSQIIEQDAGGWLLKLE